MVMYIFLSITLYKLPQIKVLNQFNLNQNKTELLKCNKLYKVIVSAIQIKNIFQDYFYNMCNSL